MTDARILVVEDEFIVALGIENRLSAMGYTVVGRAASGREAVALAARTKPDLVLMDISLGGGMDGVSAAYEVKKIHNVPVIYLTAYADEHTVERAKLTEPFGYLLKPIDERELQITIEMALYKHRIDRKVRESERMLSTTLESICDGVVATDREGRIVFMNSAAERMSGWRQDEAAGRRLEQVFRTRDDPWSGEAARTSRDSQSAGPPICFPRALLLTARDGREIPIEEESAPILDDLGEIGGGVSVYRDISERRRAERELNAVLAELKRSNTDLEDFAYIASHDLQTPLVVVSGYLDLLQRRLAGAVDEESKEYLDRAKGGTERMAQLIKDLLSYSLAGRSEKTFADIETEEILARAMENLSVAMEREGAVVTHDPLPVVTGDASLLTQLFQNLVGNAVKFRGGPPPRVHLSAMKEGEEWLFSVRDNGIGIPEEAREKVFDIFERLEKKRGTPGSGLGLAICRRIVEKHGGRIWVQANPGTGSTFFFTLPAAPAAP